MTASDWGLCILATILVALVGVIYWREDDRD